MCHCVGSDRHTSCTLAVVRVTAILFVSQMPQSFDRRRQTCYTRPEMRVRRLYYKL